MKRICLIAFVTSLCSCATKRTTSEDCYGLRAPSAEVRCENVFSENEGNGSYYFLTNKRPVHQPQELRKRASIVSELENRRRKEKGYNSFYASEPKIISANDGTIGFSGSGIEWRNTGQVDGQFKPEIKGSTMGGPEIIIGAGFAMPAPHMARENSEILVYLFAADGTVIEKKPFREFAIEQLKTDMITITRIFRDPSEYFGWQNRSVEEIKGAGVKRRNPNYELNNQYSLHFSVGENTYLKADNNFIQFRIPKEVLLKFAKDKHLEIGIIGDQLVEAMMTESVWLELSKYTMKLVSSGAVGSSADRQFFTRANVISAKVADSKELKCPQGKICIVLGLTEKIDVSNMGPAIEFSRNVPMNFSLRSNDGRDLPMLFYGFTAVNDGQNLGFVFTIDANTLIPGGQYEVHYNSSTTHGAYSWQFIDGLSVKTK